FMVQGENSTVIQYKLSKRNGARNLQLEIRPLMAFRDYHSLTHENSAIHRDVDERPGLLTFAPYSGLPSLHLAHNAAAVSKSEDWYRNFEYDAERERGLDFFEDLFNPSVLIFHLSLEADASVIASTKVRDVAKAGELRDSELARRSTIVSALPANDIFT